MGPILSIILGVGIVVLSYFLIRRELAKSVDDFSTRYPGISDDNTRVILGQFDRMESLVNDLNASYYDLISDLEGKYSLHDKEIALLEEKLQKTQLELKDVGRTISDEVRSVRSSEGGFPRPAPAQRAQEPSGRLNPSDEADGREWTEEPSVRDRRLELMNLSDSERERVRRTIVELRQKGYTLLKIAKQLNVGVGELQLFLNINRIR
jgi:hypothetical protein